MPRNVRDLSVVMILVLLVAACRAAGPLPMVDDPGAAARGVDTPPFPNEQVAPPTVTHLSPPSATPPPASTATQIAGHLVPDTIFPDDLVAYYPFEGSGQDLSGNSNHAEVRGATLTADRFANPDGAYQFDGLGSYMEVKDSKDLDLTFEMSISVWLFYKTQERPTFYTILEKSDPERGGHSRWGMWLIGDRAEVCIQPADLNLPQSCLDGETPLRPETWHHLVGTYDGSTLRMYIDGTPAGEREIPLTAIAQNNFPLFIGTDLFKSEILYTQGTIDEIRIYKRVLSPDEVGQLFEYRP